MSKKYMLFPRKYLLKEKKTKTSPFKSYNKVNFFLKKVGKTTR